MPEISTPLTARLIEVGVDEDTNQDEHSVVLSLGGHTILELPAVSRSRASHGDDQDYRDAEDQRVAAETLAEFFTRVARSL